MKKLLVISNKGIETWSEEMKKGWDEIKIIPFPHIPYGASETWLTTVADEFVMDYIGYESENDDFEYVYLDTNNTSMVFCNHILHWRFRYVEFIDPLYIPIIDETTLEPTGKMRFVRWLTVKKRYQS